MPNDSENSDLLRDIWAAILPMRNNGLSNYIVPGLTSHLIGGPQHGKIRLFEASRDVREFITPHSHRFDFTCLVLKGQAQNTIYYPGSGPEEWCESTIGQVCGENGLEDYVHARAQAPTRYYTNTVVYREGDTYSMAAEQIHSIKFTAGSRVLFFEGPATCPNSVMLEPWVNGKVVPTFKTESWMFEKLS